MQCVTWKQLSNSCVLIVVVAVDMAPPRNASDSQYVSRSEFEELSRQMFASNQTDVLGNNVSLLRAQMFSMQNRINAIDGQISPAGSQNSAQPPRALPAPAAPDVPRVVGHRGLGFQAPRASPPASVIAISTPDAQPESETSARTSAWAENVTAALRRPRTASMPPPSVRPLASGWAISYPPGISTHTGATQHTPTQHSVAVLLHPVCADVVGAARIASL